MSTPGDAPGSIVPPLLNALDDTTSVPVPRMEPDAAFTVGPPLIVADRPLAIAIAPELVKLGVVPLCVTMRFPPLTSIVPLFVFFNAGLRLTDMSRDVLLTPVALGLILALAVGKPLGILGATWAAVRVGLAQRPPSLSCPFRGALSEHRFGRRARLDVAAARRPRRAGKWRAPNCLPPLLAG